MTSQDTEQVASQGGLLDGGITRTPISRSVFCDLVRLADAFAIAAASLAAYWLYALGVLGLAERWPQFGAAAVLGVLVGVSALNHASLYSITRLRMVSYQLFRATIAWTLAVVFLIVLAFLTKTSAQFSRGWLLLWWALAVVSIAVIRFGTAHILVSWVQSGRLRRYVAIVGAGDTGQRVVEALQKNASDEIAIAGIFDDRMGRVPTQVDGHAVRGTTDDLIRFTRSNVVEQVVIALPLFAEERIFHLLKKLRELPVEIEVSLDFAGSQMALGRPVDVGGVPMLRMVDRPLKDWQSIWKAVEDVTLATLIVILVAPLMAVVALAIKLDSPGPVLFTQSRFGFNNKLIEVYKFRSMRHDMADRTGARQTVKNDPRVTRVGAFLRQSSLDELPQFINVLQRRLSIVGPRPHPMGMKAADKLYHEAVDDYAVRHRVKPGITGWAQVNGLRGETDTMEKAKSRIAHDLYYIDNWSLMFDLKIVFLTVLRGFRDPNAY